MQQNRNSLWKKIIEMTRDSINFNKLTNEFTKRKRHDTNYLPVTLTQ